jgi:hypothetical protein
MVQSASSTEIATAGTDVMAKESFDSILIESQERQRKIERLLKKGDLSERLRNKDKVTIIDMGAGAGMTSTLGLIGFLPENASVKIIPVDAARYNPDTLKSAEAFIKRRIPKTFVEPRYGVTLSQYASGEPTPADIVILGKAEFASYLLPSEISRLVKPGGIFIELGAHKNVPDLESQKMSLVAELPISPLSKDTYDKAFIKFQ